MNEPVVPSARDVRASLDSGAEPADACVVACPQNPQQRGHRGDARLDAVSDHLIADGVDCLRFDYGDWDEGYGELGDAYAALAWAQERYEQVAIAGFSFGACISILVAGGTGVDGTPAEQPALEAIAALAPPSRLNDDLVALSAMERIDVPAQVAYGTRDDIADWEPVVDEAAELGWTVSELSGDHFFVGREDAVADAVGGFLRDVLGA
jgi:alpha/beta superfamily hydrolase